MKCKTTVQESKNDLGWLVGIKDMLFVEVGSQVGSAMSSTKSQGKSMVSY